MEKELIDLFTGIPIKNKNDSTHKILKVYLSFITADLDARKKIQKMKGYNGTYGCFYCKIEGTYVKTKKHIYTYVITLLMILKTRLQWSLLDQYVLYPQEMTGKLMNGNVGFYIGAL